MKILTLAVVAIALCASSAGAGGHAVPHTRTAAVTPMSVLESLELSAGWRWRDTNVLATDGCDYWLESETDNSFYVGAELHVPVARRASLFGAFDRDFTDAPHWSARTGIAFTPFAR